MRARDVIVVARRRAGLTQQQLAGRLGVPQGTVGRWESGATEPKFQAVQAAVAACGLDLTLGFASADEGSWSSLVYEQLQRTPAERLGRLSRDGFDRVGTLQAIAAAGVRAIVVGEAAGALHGWPLSLNGGAELELLVRSDELSQARGAVAADLQQARFLDVLRGTAGFPDLARNSVRLDVDGVTVEVAALVDLLRVALSDDGPYSRRFALALDETLQLTERLRNAGQSAQVKLTERQARAEAENWLIRQTAA